MFDVIEKISYENPKALINNTNFSYAPQYPFKNI